MRQGLDRKTYRICIAIKLFQWCFPSTGTLLPTYPDRCILPTGIFTSSQTAEHRQVQRARIILLAGEGYSNAEISAKIGVHRNTVSTFIKKYLAAGLQYALSDSDRSGKPNWIFRRAETACLEDWKPRVRSKGNRFQRIVREALITKQFLCPT